MGSDELCFLSLSELADEIRRGRLSPVEVVEAHPELLGIGLDEDTAIIVQGDSFQVLGASYALIYDNQTTTSAGGKFYFLAPGDRYNLATREATRPSTTQNPVQGVERKPWGSGS